MKIDDRELRAQLREARARAELAREQWKRRRQLYEEQDAISELNYIDARTQAEQAAWWGPMAIAVIAGILFATFLTLILVPVLYSLLEEEPEPAVTAVSADPGPPPGRA